MFDLLLVKENDILFRSMKNNYSIENKIITLLKNKYINYVSYNYYLSFGFNDIKYKSPLLSCVPVFFLLTIFFIKPLPLFVEFEHNSILYL